MDNIPEQRNAAPGAPMLPAHAPQSPYTYHAAPARPGRWLVARRTTRLLLRRVLYAFARAWRVLRPYAAFIAIIVVLLGIIGMLVLALVWPSGGGTVADTRVAMIAPSEAVQQYIEGQKNFDSERMWNAFSASSQANKLDQGESKQTLKKQLEREQATGIRYAKYEYVGGVPMSNGGTLYFYSVQYAINNQQIEVPATYMVDADGKIRSITTVTIADLVQK